MHARELLAVLEESAGAELSLYSVSIGFGTPQVSFGAADAEELLALLEEGDGAQM